MFRLCLITLSLALLSACTGQVPLVDAVEVDAVEPTTASAPPVAKNAAPKPPERAIPDDSLYPLLLAEFALRRRAYDVALDNYMQQATLLRDPGVSAHTTHLTQFMRREQQAMEAVSLWVELEPDNVEANNTLATLLVRQGRAPEALPHLALVERSGERANFPVLLSDYAQLDPDQREELAAGIDALALEFPENTQLLLLQSLVHTEHEEFDAALAKLNTLFKLEPYQPQALLLEAKILLAQSAKSPFKRLQKALAADPDNSTLRLQYAQLLTTTDIDRAREQFEILSAQSPRDGDLLLSLALINREMDDDLAAKAYLRQLLGLEQRIDEAHYYLGRIAEDAGELQAAVDEYKRVEDGREYLSANSRIGRILIQEGMLEENHGWFSQQRVQRPARREQLYALEADLLSKSGASATALEVLNLALRDVPESDNLLYARAMLLEQQGELVSMEADLRTLIARDPDNTTAINALGYTLANRTERYDEALQLITRALELQPNEPAILDSMGWVLYKTGRNEEALDYLKRAYAAFPDPEVAAHLGEVLWITGANEQAIAVLQGARKKAPGHTVLNDTIQRLGIELPRIPGGDAATRGSSD
tara:strand:+ start:285141 stop:286925 length:1785 start_codon:yes stop_codon:yes gene_type:complete